MDSGNALTFILHEAGLGATPLLVAGFGELVAERAGVINVGIEGTMLAGAFAGFAATMLAGSVSAAIPAAIAAGLVMAALFALAVVWFRADQIVAGTALNLFAAGATTTGLSLLDQATGSRPVPAMYEQLSARALEHVPLIGGALAQIFSQYALSFWAIPVAMLLMLLMTRTRFGLVVRGLGDAPDACHAAGIRVRLHRTALLLFAGAMSGIAGCYLSTMRAHLFQINMTSGRGFLVLALVIFGRWNVAGFVAGVLAFSAVDGLKVFLSTRASAGTWSHLLEMLPYLVTLLALASMSRGRAGPIYLGRPWPK